MRLLFILVSLLASSCSLGQSVVRGFVKDAHDDAGIPGALVYIPDLKKGTLTDANGEFILDNLPRGKFLFQIKSLGYASVVRTIDVGLRGEIIQIRLNNSVVELSEIVISGVSHSTELKKNPIPISTMSYFTAEKYLDVAYQKNLSRLKYAPVNPATGRRGVFNMGATSVLKCWCR